MMKRGICSFRILEGLAYGWAAIKICSSCIEQHESLRNGGVE